jgi:hypothetical protein
MNCQENLAHPGVRQPYEAQDKHNAFYSSGKLLVDFARIAVFITRCGPSCARATFTSRCWRSVAVRRRLSVVLTATQLPQWQSDVYSIQSYAARHRNGLSKYDNLTNFSTQ